MATKWYPGAKKPEKYSKTGPNYAKWGEQVHMGLSYNPETDTYYADPEAAARYEAEYQSDIKKDLTPDTPGIFEQAGAAALPVAMGEGVKYLFSPSGRNWMGGLLGLGGAGAAKTAAADSGLLSGVADYGGDFLDAVSGAGSSIADYGGDFLDAVGGYAEDAYDWLAGLF